MYKSIVFMFAGQGTHYYHMGADLFSKDLVFRQNMLRLDDIVRKECGFSVIDRLYDEEHRKTDDLTDLGTTHPAIFMTEYSLAQVMRSKGVEPDYVMGCSLGEIVALAVAGAVSAEDALRFVIKHAQTVQQTVEYGRMISVFADKSFYYENNDLKLNCELAGVNYSGNFIVSAAQDKTADVTAFLKQKGVIFQELQVSYPFHSSMCMRSRDAMKKLNGTISVGVPKIPVISCLTGEITNSIDFEHMLDIPVKTMQVKKAFEAAEKTGPKQYVDLCFTGTMANFIRYNERRDTATDIVAMASIMRDFSESFKNNYEKIKLNMVEKENYTERNRKMSDTLIYAFPGQGSQKKGMGEELFDEFPEYVRRADEVLGYSIRDLCLNDSEGNLNKTNYTQPALYVVNALSYLKKIKETGRKPDFVLGHSLGEYDALFAAGAFSFEDGLRLVKIRGQLMSEIKGGAMAAVIGLDEETISNILTENGLTDLQIANINSPVQVILSVNRDDIIAAEQLYMDAGARKYVVLNVSGAFHHGKYMKAAQDKFAEYLDKMTFNKLQIPVISNYTARPYDDLRLKETLREQMSHGVRWVESIRYLLAENEPVFEQIGPGDTVYSLMMMIKRKCEPLSEEERKANILDDVPVEAVNVQEPETGTKKGLTASELGNMAFKQELGLKYAYLGGGMYKGIASPQMVIRLANAGMLGFLGTGGQSFDKIREGIKLIRSSVTDGAFGVNFLFDPDDMRKQLELVELFIREDVRIIEAAAFMSITMPLVYYKAKGLSVDQTGSIVRKNKIFAKISRPEVAEAFMSPAPQKLLNELVEMGKITKLQADIAASLPIADAITVEADSGGHTDQGVALALFPAIKKICGNCMKKYNYADRIYIGAAGGIGTPEAMLAMFMLGADYVLTGSLNQCTVEADTSDAVKDILQNIGVQDTGYAPAGDMFEYGAKVQVVKKGGFFHARANKLYSLYCNNESLEELDETTRKNLESKYFKCSFDEVYNKVKQHYDQDIIRKADNNPKYRMSLIFRWYFHNATVSAISGDMDNKVNFQIHCGPALGAFNECVRGTELESWKNRHVDSIGIFLMEGTAMLLEKMIGSYSK